MPESDSDDEEETDKDNKEDDDSSVGYSEDEEDDDTIGTALLEEEAVHSHKLTVHEPCHHVLMPLVNKHNLVTEKDNKDGWVYCAAEDEHSPCGADTILFSGKPGLTNLQMGKKPEDFFNTLWDASMWDCICDSTKEEAEAQRGSADIIVCTDKMPKLLKKHAWLTKWKAFSTQQIKHFVGLLLAMGVTKKPSIEDYWTTTGVSATHFFGEAMSWDLFQLILSNLQYQHLMGSHPKYPDPQHDAVFSPVPLHRHAEQKLFCCLQSRRESLHQQGLLCIQG